MKFPHESIVNNGLFENGCLQKSFYNIVFLFSSEKFEISFYFEFFFEKFPKQFLNECTEKFVISVFFLCGVTSFSPFSILLLFPIAFSSYEPQYLEKKEEKSNRTHTQLLKKVFFNLNTLKVFGVYCFFCVILQFVVPFVLTNNKFSYKGAISHYFNVLFIPISDLSLPTCLTFLKIAES